MKKILIFTLATILAMMLFTSCDNEAIEFKNIYPVVKVFPEPCTTWGCSVDSVKKHMSKYQLSFFDVEEKDVTLPDGSRVTKWIVAYEGPNPYDNSKIIDYDYCFDESNNGLRAVVIDLGKESQYLLSDIETQLADKDGGYKQTGRDEKNGYTFYSNGKTQVKLYSIRGKGQTDTHRKLKFWKLGDDELTWGEN